MRRADSPPDFAQATRAQALREGRAYLRGHCVESADEDARRLLLDACGIGPVSLVTEAATLVDGAQAVAYRGRLERRARGEPTSRIVGRRAFWTLDLDVRPDVLDPRGDTEALVRLAIRVAAQRGATVEQLLDLGCGSGAVICALLCELPGAFGVGVDLSRSACLATRGNLARCGLDNRSAVVRGRWLDAVGAAFDLIVSNPPYISTAEIAGLDREVRDHDPALALDGGPDGLDAYRAIFETAPRALSPSGVVAVEFGIGQAPSVIEIARTFGLVPIDRESDLGGRERAVALVLSS